MTYGAWGQVTDRAVQRCLVLLCLFSAFLLSGCNLHQDPALSSRGGCPPSSSPFLKDLPHVMGHITFCDGLDDAWTGTIETGRYPSGTRNVEVMLAGYPGTPGVVLSAVAEDGMTRFDFVTLHPREEWQRVMLDIPAEVARTPFSIRIEDSSVDKFGWAGLGASKTDLGEALSSTALPLLAAVVLANCWLIAVALCLPGAASPRAHLIHAVMVAGCLWLLVFLAYVGSTSVGGIVALLLLTLPFPLALLLRRPHRTLLKDLSQLQACLLPVLLLAVFVLWVGLFPFNWHGQANGDPALRWPHLSTDAWLPLIFGDMLLRGHLDVPMAGDWLSSDRPPLQVGLYLLFHPLLPHSRELVYQGVSTWAQALVLLPVASLLARFLDRRAASAALFTLCLSAMMLLNTLYVWPKLLAATYCLVYYMIMFPTEAAPRRWAQAGVAAALALLSHGGALFFLIGASLVNLAWYRRNSLLVLLRAAPVALLLYLPWIGYQKFVDPPGDRLLKWHFAGRIPVSDESVLSAITSAYSQLTPATWLAGRMENLSIIVKGSFNGPLNSVRIITGHPDLPLARFIDNDFFNTFHSMWFSSPLLLPPCLALIYMRSRSRPAERLALKGLVQMVAATLLYILVWATVLFEPGTATINTGGYAGVVMLQLVVLATLWRTHAALFYVVCAANLLVAASAYVLDRHFLPGLHGVYAGGVALLASALFAGSLSAFRFDSDSPTQHA